MKHSAASRLSAEPEVILLNGDIVSVDAKWSRHRAMAIRGGRIVALGSDDEIAPMKGANTQVIDLSGRQVIPGIIDLHFHMLRAYQRSVEMLKLSPDDTPTCRDVIALVEARAKTAPAGTWIEGWGLDDLRIDRLPTRAELDRAAPEHFVSLGDFSQFYLRCLNSKAMQAAHLDEMEEVPESCSLDKANGIIRGKDLGFVVDRAMPNFTDDEKRGRILDAIKWINSLGYTSINETGVGNGAKWRGLQSISSVPLYCELGREGKLNARVSLVLTANDGVGPGKYSYEQFKSFLDSMYLPADFGDEFVRLLSYNLHVDGVPMFRNAAIYGTYDTGGSGKLYAAGNTDEERAEEYARMISLAHSRRMNLAIHVAGDRATDVILDGIERAAAEHPWQPRHALYHGCLISPEALPRMKKLNVAACGMLEIMHHYTHISRKTVGETIADREYPLRSILDAGVRLFLISDCDAAEPDWRLGVEMAVRRVGKTDDRICGPSERITREEALVAFTRAAAEQEGTDSFKGTIELGKVADLCILEKDIFSVPEDEIHSVPIHMVLVDGRVVHSH